MSTSIVRHHLLTAWCVALVFCLCITSRLVFARDISTEQRAASAAREDQVAAKLAVEANANQIAMQEKRVADEHERLKRLLADQNSAKARLDTANAQLNERLETLEKVWPERNR